MSSRGRRRRSRGRPAGQIRRRGLGNFCARVCWTSRDVVFDRSSATAAIERIADFAGVGIEPVDDVIGAAGEAVVVAFGEDGCW